MSKVVAIVDWLIPENSDDGMMMVASTTDGAKLKHDSMFFHMDKFDKGIKTLPNKYKPYKEQDLLKEHLKYLKVSVKKCTSE